jgi:3-deoxy-manno-octulosonate cytidylyltransferase (CMP-KDO synthetase)
MKIIGVIPARMAASRFPGKPLKLIHGKPMVEHVYLRSKMYGNWSSLVLATCDEEISDFAKKHEIPCVMTGSHHTRALDRVAEAIINLGEPVDDDDLVVCVQGDEPMMSPDMIDVVLEPLLKDKNIPCTVLAMHIEDEDVWKNPDTVKIIHNQDGEVLYTSRAQVPYSKTQFSPDLMARRIYGIFAFRWRYLKMFTEHAETQLEILESCDSNRILDMSFRQFIAPYPCKISYSVDSASDLEKVNENFDKDPVWHLYR